MDKFILLNGPPSSGKDSVANQLAHRTKDKGYYHVEQLKFATPIVRVAQTFTPLDLSNPEEYAQFKTEINELTGLTGRELMIKISEEFVKPSFGKDFYGRYLVKNLPNNLKQTVHIISDSGFQSETDYLSNHVGEDNVIVCTIRRPGFTFENDSREEVQHKNKIYLENDSHEFDLIGKAEQLYTDLIHTYKFLEEK